MFVSQEGDLGNNIVSLERKMFVAVYILDVDMVAVDERKALFYLLKRHFPPYNKGYIQKYVTLLNNSG